VNGWKDMLLVLVMLIGRMDAISETIETEKIADVLITLDNFFDNLLLGNVISNASFLKKYNL